MNSLARTPQEEQALQEREMKVGIYDETHLIHLLIGFYLERMKEWVFQITQESFTTHEMWKYQIHQYSISIQSDNINTFATNAQLNTNNWKSKSTTIFYVSNKISTNTPLYIINPTSMPTAILSD